MNEPEAQPAPEASPESAGVMPDSQPAAPPAESAPPVDRWAHRRGEPRTFAAAWIAYLFAAAVVSLGAGGSLGLVATDAYRASARVLMVLAAIGVGALWPMLRLSQERTGSPGRAAFRDLVVVVLPLQAIIWPQALPWMAAWPVEVTAALAAHFLAWGVVVSGAIAAADHWHGAAWRWGTMAALVGAGVAAPAVRVFTGPVEDLSRRAPMPDVLLTASPFTGAWEIPADRAWSGVAGLVSRSQWTVFAVVAALGLTLWMVAAIRNPRGQPP